MNYPGFVRKSPEPQRQTPGQPDAPQTAKREPSQVFGVVVVMTSALRRWAPPSTLLIHVPTARRCSLAALTSTENFIVFERPVPAQ
jgi:hypothetical protein